MYPGDPVFKSLMEDISKGNNLKNLQHIAAGYYKLAFRYTKVMHFEKNSCTKKIYFIRSNPYVQKFMNLI